MTCEFQDAAVPIHDNKLLRSVYLPAYFKLTFEVRAVTLMDVSHTSPLNILEIADSAGTTVISVATTATLSLRVVHNNVVIAEEGSPGLIPNFSAAWTTVSITVKPFQLEFFTSSNPSFVFQGNLDEDFITVDKVLDIYASNNYDPSSEGLIRNINITGKRLLLLLCSLQCICRFILLMSWFLLSNT